jgi:hypothetical protein
MEGNRTQIDGQTEDVRDPRKIELCDGGIDLEFDAPFLCHLDSSKGTLKRAIHFSKGIVRLGSGAIDADTDSLNPRRLHFLDDFFVQ